MIRRGTVSSIDTYKGMVSVLFEEQDGAVTGMLPYLDQAVGAGLPAVGSQVVVADLDDGGAVVLGTISDRGGGADGR